MSKISNILESCEIIFTIVVIFVLFWSIGTDPSKKTRRTYLVTAHNISKKAELKSDLIRNVKYSIPRSNKTNDTGINNADADDHVIDQQILSIIAPSAYPGYVGDQMNNLHISLGLK